MSSSSSLRTSAPATPADAASFVPRAVALHVALAALAAIVSLVAFATSARPAFALEECRLLREPDIQGDRIVFVYGGDLWTVARTGGVAARLTSSDGEESVPKISPDGSTVAFSGQYDGNTDIYTVPITGGEPTRRTWHPGFDVMCEWSPDGKSLLFRSNRAMTPRRGTQFWRIGLDGGLEEKLPLPSAGYASWSPDGTKLAYVMPTYDNRTWKRYQGGNAPDIWVYDFTKPDSYPITDWTGSDEWPIWIGDRVYYVSDQGGRTANLWCYDTKDKTRRQVTTFADYDVKWASGGSDAVVFENGGNLWVLDVPGEQLHKLSVQVPDDKPALRPELKNVAKWITDYDLSPSGKRLVLAARGDIFTVPAEHGEPRNLTHSPGVRERNPAWSPDGRWIAYWSDRTGEMQLYVAPQDGTGAERQVTKTGAIFRYAPLWSPDSKKVAFADKTWSLWWCDVSTGALTKVDHSEQADITDFAWSGDSRWLAYAWPDTNGNRRIRLYALDGGRVTTVTDDMNDSSSPAFDPDGRWLYFVSRRTFDPAFGQLELDYHFTATDKIYAASLVDTTGRPTPPRSDEESAGASGKDAKGKDAKGDAGGAGKTAGAGGKETPKPVRIQLDGLGARVAELPIPAGRYQGLHAYPDHLLYAALLGEVGDFGSPPKAALHSFTLDEQEDKTVVDGVRPEFAATQDGKKVLYHKDDTYGIVAVDKENKAGDGAAPTGTLMAVVDPKLEWADMFDEAWRLERDFYYDPALGGLDWKAIGDRYRALVPYAAHRSDVNYLLGELIGELSTSHTYVGGGDFPAVPTTPGGLLGVDWAADRASGRYRFAKIFRARDWNSNVEAPLGVPGVNVNDGDYLLSVNGQDVRLPANVYAAFVGTAGKPTRITVGRTPTDPSPRTYTVTPIADEYSLRLEAWIADNRRKVDEATHGQIAYVYVPDTAIDGVKQFAKQFYPQVEKHGIIVDERWNSGGFIPDFFVERLQRTTWSYWSARDGRGFRTPTASVDGPKCILINQYAGSGGDAFPYYFRLAGLGPVIGKRTWGGLVGIQYDLPLVDGGVVTMPSFGLWDTHGHWAVENHGVDPDVEVENAPHLVAQGRDPQLERAIQYELDELAKHPVVRPERPAYKVQPGLGK